jgi:hypothetical protein
MTTTAVTTEQRKLPFVAAGATAAIIIGVGLAGFAIANTHDSVQVQTPVQHGPTAQDYAQYQHYYQGQKLADHFQYVGSGGRVQLGQ